MNNVSQLHMDFERSSALLQKYNIDASFFTFSIVYFPQKTVVWCGNGCECLTAVAR